MRQLFIHIGTHKTGSSAIQTALHSHRNSLASDNLKYLPLPIEAIRLMLVEEVDDVLITSLRDQYEEMAGLDSTNENNRYITSFEGFSGNPTQGYRNSWAVAESLKKIFVNFDCKIVVCLRSQDDFIESLYTQVIHEGGSCLFSAFADSLQQDSFRWDLLLEQFAARFGKKNIFPIRYHRKFLPKSTSLLKKFANIIETKELNKPANLNRVNTGYSREALELARYCNPHLSTLAKKRLRDILQRTNSKPRSSTYSFMDQSQRERLMMGFEASNESVLKDYFNNEDPPLFPKPETNIENAYEGMSLKKLLNVCWRAVFYTNPPKGISRFHFFLGNVRRLILLVSSFLFGRSD